MIRGLACALAMLIAAPAWPDETIQRPVAREDRLAAPSAPLRPLARRTTVPQATQSGLRPRARASQGQPPPLFTAAPPQLRAEKNLFAFSPTAPARSTRPSGRSPAFIQIMADRQAAIARGMVCGDPAIQGDAIGTVPGRGACGIENAVRVRSVLGVQLTPASRMDCQTAQALKTWVEQGLLPATDNQASAMRVVGGYSCRFRNGAISGRLSEHAFGRAIDIAGIGLKDGREMTLLTGWNNGQDGPAFRQMWRAACGPFGTVLGPESNRFHRDHFHFDTARYRSGPFCR